ncbi:MAG: hypothetical protein RLZZ303_3120, partial [Candidatus Hydrogenedentota bacterium]
MALTGPWEAASGRLPPSASVRNPAAPGNDQTSLPESGSCTRKIDPEQKFVALQTLTDLTEHTPRTA